MKPANDMLCNRKNQFHILLYGFFQLLQQYVTESWKFENISEIGNMKQRNVMSFIDAICERKMFNIFQIFPGAFRQFICKCKWSHKRAKTNKSVLTQSLLLGDGDSFHHCEATIFVRKWIIFVVRGGCGSEIFKSPAKVLLIPPNQTIDH